MNKWTERQKDEPLMDVNGNNKETANSRYTTKPEEGIMLKAFWPMAKSVYNLNKNQITKNTFFSSMGACMCVHKHD